MAFINFRKKLMKHPGEMDFLFHWSGNPPSAERRISNNGSSFNLGNDKKKCLINSSDTLSRRRRLDILYFIPPGRRPYWPVVGYKE